MVSDRVIGRDATDKVAASEPHKWRAEKRAARPLGVAAGLH
jgi:hypothetical protein